MSVNKGPTVSPDIWIFSVLGDKGHRVCQEIKVLHCVGQKGPALYEAKWSYV